LTKAQTEKKKKICWPAKVAGPPRGWSDYPTPRPKLKKKKIVGHKRLGVAFQPNHPLWIANYLFFIILIFFYFLNIN
jgi:hypothetical protein